MFDPEVQFWFRCDPGVVFALDLRAQSPQTKAPKQLKK